MPTEANTCLRRRLVGTDAGRGQSRRRAFVEQSGLLDGMPKPFLKEFRADVIAVARQGDQSIAQVARSFEVSESCLTR